jgi:hypothetical protein
MAYSLTHKRIKRFQIDGILKDDSDIIRLRKEYELVLIESMREDGYIRVLDIDPAFSVSYNQEENIWSFVLTIHGVYVGKVKAWQIEGCSNGKMLPRSTQNDKSKKYSNQFQSQ